MTRALKSKVKATTKAKTKAASPSLVDALKPRLRIFLSVDLVGSTAFKQARPPELLKQNRAESSSLGPAWFKSILSFYRDFESMLREQWASFNAECEIKKLPECNEPEFWKSNGDELLYTFELREPSEAASIMILWLSTLENYRRALRSNTPELDIKSAAWIAGFPVMNSEVIFREGIGNSKAGEADDALLHQHDLLNIWYSGIKKRAGLTKDYVGPAIDTGFRIAGWASSRKMVISVDLALLLTGTSLDHNIKEKFSIFFDGTQPLKGVVGGRPYPIIWIQVDGVGALVEKEDKLLKRSPANHNEIQAYCEEYIRENSEFLMRPFVYNTSDRFFSETPQGYIEHLMKWQHLFSREKKLAASQRRSLDPSAQSDGDNLQDAVVEQFVESISKTPS
jgi:hypothetical protein